MLDIDKLFELAAKHERQSISLGKIHRENIKREKYINALNKTYNSSNFCLYYIRQYTDEELRQRLIDIKKEIDKVLSK